MAVVFFQRCLAVWLQAELGFQGAEPVRTSEDPLNTQTRLRIEDICNNTAVNDLCWHRVCCRAGDSCAFWWQRNFVFLLRSLRAVACLLR